MNWTSCEFLKSATSIFFHLPSGNMAYGPCEEICETSFSEDKRVGRAPEPEILVQSIESDHSKYQQDSFHCRLSGRVGNLRCLFCSANCKFAGFERAYCNPFVRRFTSLITSRANRKQIRSEAAAPCPP